MNKFFKIFFSLLLIISLYAILGIILINKEQTREVVRSAKNFINPPCSRPLEYSIGEVDLRFGITRAEFEKLAEDAQFIWENSTGKNLFQYNPDAKFKINLIYDDRQEETIAAEGLEQDLNKLELSHEGITSQYEKIQSQYQQKIKRYEKDMASYEKDLEKYNDEVEYWNDQGGAPKDEYEDLEKKKKDLKDRYIELEKQRKEINSLAGETNNLVSQEKQLSTKYNTEVATYKNKFGNSKEFEKGVFGGESINIYQFKEKSDLELTLSHELGHYLGLEHVENLEAIMYYLIGEQDLENPTLAKEDISELKRACKLN
jgi:hypothetical protein